MHVKAEKITKQFGTVTALDGVSLEIETGEFFFLLGPSGCGKTTLLRALAGFEQPESGQLWFDDAEVSRVPPEKRGTALVFQNYALWPHLTVEENIRFGLDVLKLSRSEQDKRLHEVMELVRMREYLNRRPGQLSGGQQQRVALARALVVKPKLVLLDEPLSNLDARLRLQMRTEIREIIKESGHTAVYVTHDQKEALSMADRCAILNEGRIEQIGRPQDLYQKPTNSFVAQFLGEINNFRGRVREKTGSETYSVELSGSELVWRVTSPRQFSEGDPVVCGVRPEAWQVCVQGQRADNVLSAEIVNSVFLGEVTQHTVRTSLQADESIRVLELNCPPRPNGPISLCVAPDAVVLLPQERG